MKQDSALPPRAVTDRSTSDELITNSARAATPNTSSAKKIPRCGAGRTLHTPHTPAARVCHRGGGWVTLLRPSAARCGIIPIIGLRIVIDDSRFFAAPLSSLLAKPARFNQAPPAMMMAATTTMTANTAAVMTHCTGPRASGGAPAGRCLSRAPSGYILRSARPRRTERSLRGACSVPCRAIPPRPLPRAAPSAARGGRLAARSSARRER